jgi:hypothetical protein
MKALLLPGILFAIAAQAQQLAPTVQAVDGAIARESALLQVLETRTPVVETYIQEMASDNDFGTVLSGITTFSARSIWLMDWRRPLTCRRIAAARGASTCLPDSSRSITFRRDSPR